MKHTIVVLPTLEEDGFRLMYGLGVEFSGTVFVYIHGVLALILRTKNYAFVGG